MRSKICPDCGAALDATESCDCRRNPYHGRPYRPKPINRKKDPPPELIYDTATGTMKMIVRVRK